jgi:hypothetical protein
MLAIASLSSSQLNANPFSADSGNVPGFPAFPASTVCPGDGAGTAIMEICRIVESRFVECPALSDENLR